MSFRLLARVMRTMQTHFEVVGTGEHARRATTGEVVTQS